MRALFGAIICIIVGAIGMMVLSSVLGGFVLVKLWGWFIIPTFGLPALSIPVAIGITLMSKYMTIQKKPEMQDDDFVSQYSFAIAFPLVTLIIGWIVHFFV